MKLVSFLPREKPQDFLTLLAALTLPPCLGKSCSTQTRHLSSNGHQIVYCTSSNSNLAPIYSMQPYYLVLLFGQVSGSQISPGKCCIHIQEEDLHKSSLPPSVMSLPASGMELQSCLNVNSEPPKRILPRIMHRHPTDQSARQNFVWNHMAFYH